MSKLRYVLISIVLALAFMSPVTALAQEASSTASTTATSTISSTQEAFEAVLRQILQIIIQLLEKQDDLARELKQGSQGPDVKNLQKMLNWNPYSQVARTGTGSPGHETEYYGEDTRDAVRRWQMMNMAPGTYTPGIVDANTLAAMQGEAAQQGRLSALDRDPAPWRNTDGNPQSWPVTDIPPGADGNDQVYDPGNPESPFSNTQVQTQMIRAADLTSEENDYLAFFKNYPSRLEPQHARALSNICGKKYGVPGVILFTQIYGESGFNPTSNGDGGTSLGLTQISNSAYKSCTDREPFIAGLSSSVFSPSGNVCCYAWWLTKRMPCMENGGINWPDTLSNFNRRGRCNWRTDPLPPYGTYMDYLIKKAGQQGVQDEFRGSIGL